jgi:hypothetical protein
MMADVTNILRPLNLEKVRGDALKTEDMEAALIEAHASVFSGQSFRP